jgi:DNA-binding transcriptional ArsR family regulator
MSENYLPLDKFLIEDLETLRVVADPLRNQMLEIFIEKPHTVRQVAEKLGLSPSKLYYHVSLLEKHGLIRVVETHQVGNLLEKVYQATAPELEVEKSLLTFATEEGKESIYSMMTATLDTTREDLLRSLQARLFELEHGAKEQPRRVVLNRTLSNLTDSRASELQERLCELVQEFADADVDVDEDDTHLFALTVAFYPTFYFPGE